MIKYENQCVDCGFPCIQEACRYYKVQVHYCDQCGEKCAKYKVEDEDLCEDCVRNLCRELFEDLNTQEQAEILEIGLRKLGCDFYRHY